MASKSTESNGIGITGVLLVAFIVLKLCNVIAWSWWWVLAPMWIPFVILCLVLLISMVVKGYNETK